MAENQKIQARLLEAGILLMDNGQAPGQLTSESIAAKAGLLEADFTACYPGGLQAYRAAVLQWLLDEAREAANHATDPMPRTLARLKRGVEVYLDHGLRRPCLRALVQNLQTEPGAAQLHNNRVRGWIFFFQIELAALGVANPQARAQLCIGMAASIAQAEYEAGGVQPELRETLYAYMDRLPA